MDTIRSMLKFSGLFCSCFFFAFLVCCVGKQNYPILEKLSALPVQGACRIAVLPFQNNSKYTLGGTLVYRVFVAELSRRTVLDVVQEGDVLYLLRQLRVPFGALPNHEQRQIFSDRVKANLLIEGVITEMHEEKQGDAAPALSIEIKLLDAGSGRTIFTTYHRKTGDSYRKILHFGTINTITKLAKTMSREVIQLWDLNGFNHICRKKQ